MPCNRDSQHVLEDKMSKYIIYHEIIKQYLYSSFHLAPKLKNFAVIKRFLEYRHVKYIFGAKTK